MDMLSDKFWNMDNAPYLFYSGWRIERSVGMSEHLLSDSFPYNYPNYVPSNLT